MDINSNQSVLRPMMKISEMVPYLKNKNIKFEECSEEEAEKYFIECIDAEEVEAGAYYYLARIAMIKGETDKAKNYANIAIEENPTVYEKMAEENI